MNAGEFGTMLTNLIEAGAHRLILDLSALEYLGSGGVRALLLAQKAVAARGGKMALLNCRPPVHEVLRICGLEQIAPTVESMEAARRTVG
jgi:anti-anti-sigma factor